MIKGGVFIFFRGSLYTCLCTLCIMDFARNVLTLGRVVLYTSLNTKACLHVRGGILEVFLHVHYVASDIYSTVLALNS